MSIPTSRNTTYSPGSPIFSVDLNAIQDAIVAGKHGSVEHVRSAVSVSGSVWSNTRSISIGSTDTMPLDADPGATVLSASVIMSVAGSAIYHLQIWREPKMPAGSPVLVAQSPDSMITTANQRLVITQSSINAGSGLLIDRDTAYYFVMAYVSGGGAPMVISRYAWFDTVL